MKLVWIVGFILISTVTFSEETQPLDHEIDLTLINDTNYDLSKPIFGVRPTLGRGLRDMQNSAGGSACTSCAH